jgi:hypothetical protein
MPGNGLKMCRITTGMMAAEMIELESLRNRSYKALISIPMHIQERVTP